jgi:hypothetical protein
MALKITVTTKFGFVAEDAYVSIGHIQQMTKNTMAFSINYKKDKDAMAFDAKTFNCQFNIDGKNPYVQAYEHLKTLPEFSGATDC